MALRAVALVAATVVALVTAGAVALVTATGPSAAAAGSDALLKLLQT